MYVFIMLASAVLCFVLLQIISLKSLNILLVQSVDFATDKSEVCSCSCRLFTKVLQKKKKKK